MPQPIRVLVVEDNPEDAELIVRELRQAGFEPDWQRVDTEADYLAGLQTHPDVVLSDYVLPQFSGPRGLELLNESGRDIPFLIISGTIGEDIAVAAMRQGAADYLLKDRLGRLGAAVERALEASRLRQEHRRIEHIRREDEKRYQALIRTAMDGFCVWDQTGQFLEVSESCCALLGYSRAQLLAMNLAHLDLPESPANTNARTAEIQTRGWGRFEAQVRRADGQSITIEVSTVYFPARGEFLSFIRDLTARRRAEAEHQRLEIQLRQAQKMEALGYLSGGIAHDFNNILAAILGYSELAKLDLGAAHPALRDLEEVLKAGERGKKLVQQILTFARQQPQQKSVVALQAIVAESLQLLRATIPAGVEINFTTVADVPPVLADATQIHQVLLNLGANACHALEGQPGSITVTLDSVDVDEMLARSQPDLSPGHYVRLSMTDTGKGMEAPTLERIFDPFFTTKPPGQGTGLGLSVVHGTMKSHQGAVRVASEPGLGSTFHLYFPAVTGNVASADSAKRMQPHGQGQRVLCVDDERPVVMAAARLLERSGYRVFGYISPEEALQAFRKSPAEYDLAITDQNMPGMTGLDFARELLALRPDLPVLLSSGNITEDLLERIQELGIRAVVQKPSTAEELSAAVARHLATRTTAGPSSHNEPPNGENRDKASPSNLPEGTSPD